MLTARPQADDSNHPEGVRFATIGYVLIVVGFKIFVIYMGASHADRGLSVDEDWIVLTTTDKQGGVVSTVMAGSISTAHCTLQPITGRGPGTPRQRTPVREGHPG